MRELTGFAVNAANEGLKITVLDEPGAGGANHEYQIDTPPGQNQRRFRISFQNGTIPENGVNGVTQEALLAVVIDRLRSFQAGKFACRENALALTRLEEAMHWLQHRTRSRLDRGVEGSHKV
jgi:hypothetical protein